MNITTTSDGILGNAVAPLGTVTPSQLPVQAGFRVSPSISFLGYLIALVYRIAFWLLSLVTYQIPRWTIAVLSWGGVISLEFNAVKLFLLFVAFSIGLNWAIKARYLNRYTKLRETPLRTDEKLDLHPDVAAETGSTGINNYLDEFLSAIKVFGYLEKPVFHELARHLQTKRLIAGDTLSLDSSDFYVVVDGSVQVFAQMQRGGLDSSGAFDEDDDQNGFQLLNEVETGGTLSSLFTILRLFTEDVKLRYEEVHDDDHSMSFSRSPDVPSFSLDTAHPPLRSPSSSRARGGHSANLRHARGSSSQARSQPTRNRAPSHLRNSFSSETTITEDDGSSPVTAQGSANGASQLNLDARDAMRSHLSARETQQAFSDSRTHDAVFLDEDSEDAAIGMGPHTNGDGTNSNGYSAFSTRTSRSRARRDSRQTETPDMIQPLESTIARAKVDATLAVIPADAFKRLTKKFPKASAHIVQVILTRLHRVTFYTAHEYLGLTKELVKTERAINDLASYPLPSVFYESGGIERLRQRFLPETKAVDRGKEDKELDYFALEKNHRKNSFAPETPYHGPRMGRNMHQDSFIGLVPEAIRLRHKRSSGSIRNHGNTESALSTSPTAASDLSSPLDIADGAAAGRRDSTGPMPRPRVSRNVGDLLSMTSLDELSSSTISVSPDKSSIPLPSEDEPIGHSRKSGARHLSFAIGPADEFDLRDEVMTCISKCIGLIQPSSSVSPSVDASPVLNPVDANLKRAVFSSSFGSLSYLGFQGRDDESSSVTASSATGGLEGMDLENETEILFFPRGSVLCKAGERGPGLFFVIEGWLDVLMPEGHIGLLARAGAGDESGTTLKSPLPVSAKLGKQNSKTGSQKGSRVNSGTSTPRETAAPQPEPAKASKPLFSVKPGGIAGYLSSLSGFPSYVDIKAKTDVYVGFLPAKALERIMDRRPIVLLTLAKRLISLLPPLVVHIDSALEWMQVNAGQVIYRQGEKADSFYFVNQGRLRSIADKPGTGGVEILAEFGQGDSVGELDCITATPRPSTLHAIRDSELTRMPMTLFNAISVRYPSVTIQISRIIGQRVRAELDSRRSPTGAIASPGTETGRSNFNLKTIAILPVTYQVPVTEFATRLKAALEDIGAPASYLNQATVMHVQGRHAFSKMGKLKLAGWLSETEQKYRIVLYVADTAVSSPWTQTCIRQADCILLVAHGAADPAIGEYERLLVGMKTTARKELVLLHSERAIPAGSTRPWLQARPWIHAWTHCEMPDVPAHRSQAFQSDLAPVTALKELKNKVQVQIGKYRRAGAGGPTPHRNYAMSDFARLARRLCGKSIGVVLGGGGARGLAHIGVLRALQDAGVPVDLVGGTSIGSFIGGLYAREGDLVSTLGRAKRFSGRMASLWRMLTDVTYPLVAYTTGHEFNRGIYKSFYDYHIEDMWLTFFCNTTNIRHSRMDVHTTGYAWRYIRASMTLVGLLPPLSDEGNMLVDGGYTDNLPVSYMLSLGAHSVFAVDVGSIDDTSPREFGESVSGWWVLLNRWNPWSATRTVPGITEIQSRLTYVSSVKTLEEAKATPGVLYMRMPVEGYGTMQFGKFNEIMETGYQAARKMIAQWQKEGKMPTGLVDTGNNLKDGASSSRPGAAKPIRRNSI